MISKTKLSMKRLQIAITNQCDSKCIYCNFWKNKSVRQLKIEDLKRLFDIIPIEEITLIAITGGEPTEHPQINKIINYVYNRTKIKPLLSTNGLNSDRLESILKKLKNKISTLSLSVDGPKEIHNLYRGRKEAYSNLIRSIKLSKKYGLKLKLAMTLLKNNVKYITKLIKKYGEGKVDIKYASVSKYYYGNNLKKSLKKEEIAKKLYYILRKYYTTHKIKNLYNFYNAIYVMHGIRPICTEGGNELFVSPDGKIYGCYHKKEIADLRKVNNKKLLLKREKFIKKNIFCSECFGRCGSTVLETYKKYYRNIANKIRLRWGRGERFPEKDFFRQIISDPEKEKIK